MKSTAQRKQEYGFSTIELLIVILITGIIAAMAVPGYMRMMRYLRLSGDARSIAEEMGVAKMRAAANFTDTRVYLDMVQRTYHVDVWDKQNNCWRPDLTPAGGCLGGAAAPVAGQPLSQTITFGFGAVGAPPPNVTGGMQQANPCYFGGPGGATPNLNPWQGGAIANTACVVFNSRGVPIDNTAPNVLNGPVTNDAVYVADGNGLVYAVTVSQTGVVRTWSTPDNAVNWTRR